VKEMSYKETPSFGQKRTYRHQIRRVPGSAGGNNHGVLCVEFDLVFIVLFVMSIIVMIIMTFGHVHE
jgi:hypothetical protein